MMDWKTKLFKGVCIAVVFTELLVNGAELNDPTIAAEFRQRDGLPNFFNKIQEKKTIKIAYLGGSITAANGWRMKTMAWFEKQFPQATFSQINVSISGTGSDFAACRLNNDLLPQKPDLVFLECRVNGGGGFERESVEGVVRQIWRDNPQTDICFIYTIDLSMLKNIQMGRLIGFGEILERVANQYGIPSIDMGVEIAKLEQNGALTFKAAAPEDGKILFSRDGTHPGDEGHNIYCKVIAQSMLKMQDKAAVTEHKLSEPMYKNCWEVASLLPITEAQLSSGWTSVNLDTDIIFNDDLNRTKAMLRGAVKCDHPGETITVRWTGTTLGFSDIPHAGPMLVEAVIDGKQRVSMERKQTAERKYARFWYLPEQSPGAHEVCLTIKQLPEGASFYAGQILIIGTPLNKREL